MKVSELLLNHFVIKVEDIISVKIVVFDPRKDIRIFITIKNINSKCENNNLLFNSIISAHVLEDGFQLSDKYTTIDVNIDKLDEVLDKIKLLT